MAFTAAVPQALASEVTPMKPLVAANTAFALQLYGTLRSTEGNVALSPYSISAALGMTYAGARGDTARQMEQTLHFAPVKADLHTRFGRLDAALKAAQGSNELSIANSLWPQKAYPFREDFLNLLNGNYGATATAVDYERETERARVAINRWVDGKTKHKIADLLAPGVLDPLTRMVLVNAIYFKGTWLTPFPESATRPERFYVRPDAPLTVPFMHQRLDFRYGENDRLQMLALPYVGRQLEMVVLLPRSRDGLAALESSLSPASLAEWTSGMREREVDVALPKFKISSAFSLAEALKAMGMKDAFDPMRADFSGMDGKMHWLYLSAVLHQAHVEVNEKGTQAAAATAVGVALSSARNKEPARKFQADHPFLFLIRDSATGTILLTGRVMKPGQ